MSKVAPWYRGKVHLRSDRYFNGVRCNASGEKTSTDDLASVTCAGCLRLVEQCGP